MVETWTPLLSLPRSLAWERLSLLRASPTSLERRFLLLPVLHFESSCCVVTIESASGKVVVHEERIFLVSSLLPSLCFPDLEGSWNGNMSLIVISFINVILGDVMTSIVILDLVDCGPRSHFWKRNEVRSNCLREELGEEISLVWFPVERFQTLPELVRIDSESGLLPR